MIVGLGPYLVVHYLERKVLVVMLRLLPGLLFVCLSLISISLSAQAQEAGLPALEGTLHLLSFGAGAPMEGPPVDDLYGRDAGFVVEALKRSPSPWRQVESTFVSGLECTPERMNSELERLVQNAKPGDLVFVHASTHGTTEEGLFRLDSELATIIDASVLAAGLSKLPCPALVTIDACEAGGALRSALPKQSAWLLGCSETQSTSGQTDDPKVPHGFLILAMCEALRGDADSDRDGLVTIGELFKWVPPRATDLARNDCEQEAVVVLPDELATLPLTRAMPGEHKPLWPANGQMPVEKIEAVIAAELKRRQIPGAAVAVIHKGREVLLKGYGLANVEHDVPVNIDTVFQSASVHKQFTAAIVLKLAEQKKLSLEPKQRGQDGSVEKYR